MRGLAHFEPLSTRRRPAAVGDVCRKEKSVRDGSAVSIVSFISDMGSLMVRPYVHHAHRSRFDPENAGKPVHELLLLILRNLQAGRAISIVPEHQQLTTQRAADILGVSRPFLVRLLESGDIPFHMVGSHRRIYLRDLLEYKRQRDAARHEAINNMARAEMEAGTYDTVVLLDGAEDE